jgi:diaminopimelate epimerase
LTPERVKLICDRNRGVGSDGILVLSPALPGSDVGLRILNPDGSEAEKSGNGIRIFAKWLFDTGRTTRTSFVIGTLGGNVPVDLETSDGRATMITALMGTPEFREDLTQLEVGGETLAVTAVSMGNPHFVVIRNQLDVTDLRRLGPLIEHHPAFPNRTNVQFARPLDRQRVQALIWERGAGETLASGSSSCAVAAACHRLGLLDREITVVMMGGDLAIRIDDRGAIWMRGPAEEIAQVTLSPDLLARLRALA